MGFCPDLNFDLNHFDRNFFMEGGIKFTKIRKDEESDLKLKGVEHSWQQSLWSWTAGLRHPIFLKSKWDLVYKAYITVPGIYYTINKYY